MFKYYRIKKFIWNEYLFKMSYGFVIQFINDKNVVDFFFS